MIKERTIICEASTLSWVGRGRVPLNPLTINCPSSPDSSPPLPYLKIVLSCAASFPSP